MIGILFRAVGTVLKVTLITGGVVVAGAIVVGAVIIVSSINKPKDDDLNGKSILIGSTIDNFASKKETIDLGLVKIGKVTRADGRTENYIGGMGNWFKISGK